MSDASDSGTDELTRHHHKMHREQLRDDRRERGEHRRPQWSTNDASNPQPRKDD
jgi:hypothetical protein